MDLLKPTEPIEPVAPVLPPKPQEFLENKIISIDLSERDNCDLMEVLAFSFIDATNINQYDIKIDNVWNGNDECWLRITRKSPAPNPEYIRQMEIWQEQRDSYQEDMVAYNAKMEIYKKEKSVYDIALKAYNRANHLNNLILQRDNIQATIDTMMSKEEQREKHLKQLTNTLQEKTKEVADLVIKIEEIQAKSSLTK